MKTLAVSLAVVLTAFVRLIPHPPNCTPMISLALFAGAYSARQGRALLAVFLALFLSDAAIGFYSPSLMLCVYLSTGLIVILGSMFKGRVRVGTVAGYSLLGSAAFFLLTNFGVWIMPGSHYPMTIAGLATCFALAIPFLGWSLLGTAVSSAVMFGAYEMCGRMIFKSGSNTVLV